MKKASFLIFGLFCLLFFSYSASAQTNCTYSYSYEFTGNYVTNVGNSNSTRTYVVFVGGGSGTITVTTQPGCAWSPTVIPNPNFLSGLPINISLETRTGSGVVAFEVSPTGSSRVQESGIVLPGKTLWVGKSRFCEPFSGGIPTTPPPPPNQTFTSAGGTGTFLTAVRGECSVSVNSDVSWLTVENTFTGRYNFTVAPNAGNARTGTITVTGLDSYYRNDAPKFTYTITINQATLQCTYSLAPQNVQISPSGTTDSFQTTTEAGCNWTASTASNWITLNTSSGTGTGRVNYTANANNTGQVRTGTITVGGQTFTITQPAACSYVLTPSGALSGATGGGGAFQVNTTPDCSWNASSSADWITITSGIGTGSGTVNYNVQPNTGAARTGTIIVGGQSFTISQTSACSYTLSNAPGIFSASGGTGSFTLTANDVNCSWSVLASAQWITFTGNTAGIGNATVTFTVAANNGSARTGTIVVANYFTLQINQDGVITQPSDLIMASGKVITPNFKPIRGALVTFTDTVTGETKMAVTSMLGYFHLRDIERGRAYRVTIMHKRHKFSGNSTVIYNTSGLIQIFTSDFD